jgi:hypothetical protein
MGDADERARGLVPSFRRAPFFLCAGTVAGGGIPRKGQPSAYDDFAHPAVTLVFLFGTAVLAGAINGVTNLGQPS